MKKILKKEGKLKDLRLRVESTATDVPERIADVRDEESSEEDMSDTVDTPRHQIYKKRRRIVGVGFDCVSLQTFWGQE